MTAFAYLILLSISAVIIFPNADGFHYEISDYKNHPCMRDCRINSSMVCEYNFTVEYYFTLTKACYDCPFNKSDCNRPHCVPADGTARAILTVNRMLPGPAIYVCEGDTVMVNVYNRLEGGEGLTIHFHGIHQRNYQHMDGVAMVTQCPIAAHSIFQYRFVPSNTGTHFWHAHSGLQRSDGIFGALIVREPPQKEKHLGFYDYDLPEHVVLINDWLVELTVNRFAQHHHAGGDNKPASMLINGKGAYQEFSRGNETITTPYETFTVKQGRRYRFRVISNGILNCPIQLSVDYHTLIIIASDGNPFKPMAVESVNIFAGERYDFVLYANQSQDNYWFRIRGEADCSVKQAMQLAVLRYEKAAEGTPSGIDDYESSRRGGRKLNPWNKKKTDELIPVTELKSLLPDDEALKEVPDKKFYLSMDFNIIDNYRFHDPNYYPISSLEKMHLYSPQINHITSILPPAPILTQLQDIPKELLCNAETVNKNCSEEFCECVHHLKVALGDTVEFVILDEGKIYDANHPMHLHGFSYRVIGMDRLGKSTTLKEVMELDNAGMLNRTLNQSVAKDTVTVPDGGYVILRIHATNPGFWFFHCHIEFHAEIGMGLVLQVGETADMPPTPKNFPTCGTWRFTGYRMQGEDDDGFPFTNECKNPNNADNVHTSILMIFVTIITALFLN